MEGLELAIGIPPAGCEFLEFSDLIQIDIIFGGHTVNAPRKIARRRVGLTS